MAVINLKCFDVQSTEIQSKQFTSRPQRETSSAKSFHQKPEMRSESTIQTCTAIKRTFFCYFATEKLMSEQSKVSNLFSFCQRKAKRFEIVCNCTWLCALWCSWQLGGTFSFASKVFPEFGNFFIFLLSEVLTFTSLHNCFRIWMREILG